MAKNRKNSTPAEASEKEIRKQYRDIIGGTIDMRDIATILRKVASVFVSIFALVSGTVRKAETALKAAGIDFNLDALRDDCAKAVQRWVDIGADQLCFSPTTNNLPTEVVVESMELFGKEVLPQFDKDPVHSTTRQREAFEKSL